MLSLGTCCHLLTVLVHFRRQVLRANITQLVSGNGELDEFGVGQVKALHGLDELCFARACSYARIPGFLLRNS